MKQLQLLLICFLLNTYLVQSQNTISGTIISGEDNQSLIGATIVVKGTTVAAQSDFNGKYSIKAQPDQTLVFSYVGFVTTEVAINGLSVIDLVLKPDVVNIEQVIVAGVAANTPKSKVSISVSKVNASDLEQVPGASAVNALQGKVAGVTIVNASGNPGSSSGVRLRGSTSVIGDSKPLIIVDGVMLEGDMSDINADDIADIQIVKGAASTALYGSRAGNGVIVITSKRGSSNKDGKWDIRVRNEYGIQQLGKKIELSKHNPYKLSSDYNQETFTKFEGVEYPAGYVEGFDTRIKGTPDDDYDHYIDNPYARVIDHQDDIFGTGRFFTNYVSMGATINKTQAFLSFENNKNSGIVYNTEGSDRQNVRLNLDHTLFEKLKLKSSTLYTQIQIDQASGDPNNYAGGGKGSAFYSMLFMSPDVDVNMSTPSNFVTPATDVRLSDFFYKPDQWSREENPKHALYYENKTTQRKSILQNFNIDYQLASWLSLNGDYSIESFTNNNDVRKPAGYQLSNLKFIKGQLTSSDQIGLSTNMQFTANINKVFGDFVVRSKLSYQNERFDEKWDFYNSLDTLVKRHGLDSVFFLKNNHKVFATRSRDYYAILDADYKNRYIISTLFRYDGSSLFGEDARWNPYYRFSLGWRINEDLKIKNIQELKLRSSIGTSGQRPRFNYQYEAYNIINNILRPNQLGNKNLKPSQTTELELALDAQLFNKIDLTIGWSTNTTRGAYYNVPLSAKVGFVSQYQNAVDMRSSGIEASVGLIAIKKTDMNLRFNVTFDHFNQKIIKLNTNAFSNNLGFRIAEGESFGTMYGYKWLTSLDEMKQQLPEGRNIEDYTVNSDGYVIEKGTEGTLLEKPISTKNNVKIADMNPLFNLAFSTYYNYRNFDFSMLWFWKQGGDIYNTTRQLIYRENRHGEQDQFNKPENQKKAYDYYQTLYLQGNKNSHFVEDGSFVKLREVSVYYNLKIKNFNKYVKNIKIGVLGRNLYTFTRYSGWDPEVASGDDLSNYIIDEFNYPNFRSYSASIEFKF